jgi:hypothetical protein
MGPPTLFAIPVLRYMKSFVAPAKAGPSGERRRPGALGSRLRGNDQINCWAMVSVVQREWAAKNPRATFKAPITVVIVSLGLVRFRRAAALMEAKIRSIGTMQLPHSHRILVGKRCL